MRVRSYGVGVTWLRHPDPCVLMPRAGCPSLKGLRVALPLPLMPVPRQRFYTLDADGFQPLAGGKLQFFTVGTSTPLAVYADPDGNTSLGAEVTLDADGYASAIYLQPTGYRVRLLDSDDVQIFQVDGVEDSAMAILANLGTTFYAGSKGVAHDYVVVEDDYLITVNESVTTPAVINLPAAASRTHDITIKNIGATPLAVTPNGSDTIEGLASAFSVAAASSPVFPTLTLRPDGVSNWFIVSSHRLT